MKNNKKEFSLDHKQPRFLQSSAVFIHQAWTINPTVGDTARSDQHAVARPTSEVAAAAHRPIVLALWVSELQTQPKARSEFGCAEVTDERHLIGTA